MKMFFISMMLFIVTLIIIPVGAMNAANPMHNIYIYVFLCSEIVVTISIVRVYLISKRK